MKILFVSLLSLLCACGGTPDNDTDASQSPDAHAEAATSSDAGPDVDSGALGEAGLDGEAETGPPICNPPCSPSTGTCCAGICVNEHSDPYNCGMCGNECTGGSCDAGTCAQCTDDIGTCPHSPCETGAALTMLCDPQMVTIYVCSMNHACCSTGWTSACVTIAKMYVAGMCSGCI